MQLQAKLHRLQESCPYKVQKETLIPRYCRGRKRSVSHVRSKLGSGLHSSLGHACAPARRRSGGATAARPARLHPSSAIVDAAVFWPTPRSLAMAGRTSALCAAALLIQVHSRPLVYLAHMQCWSRASGSNAKLRILRPLFRLDGAAAALAYQHARSCSATAKRFDLLLRGI